MKKLLILFSTTALLTASSIPLSAVCKPCHSNYQDALSAIPVVQNESPANSSSWVKVDNVAQYGRADWNNAVSRAQNVSLKEAQQIADNDPQITFFFWVKGGRMVLTNPEVTPPAMRVFYHGDAVFFTGQPWWGSAPDLADGYIKQDVNQD